MVLYYLSIGNVKVVPGVDLKDAATIMKVNWIKESCLF